MNTINQDDFKKLSKALYDLEELLGSMGVKEFSLSANNHHMQIDTATENIDTDLLATFCGDIERLYITKFGANTRRRAA